MIAAAKKSLFAGHEWHAVEILGVAVVSLVGIWLYEAVQRRRQEATGEGASRPPLSLSGSRRYLLWLVALASTTAGAVHLWVMPEHFEESALYGWFFLLSSLIQFAYSGWLLRRPSTRALVVGAVGNIAIVLLWTYTRTVAIPLGPATGEVEAVGTLDVICSFFELVTAAGALALLRVPNPRTRSHEIHNGRPSHV